MIYKEQTDKELESFIEKLYPDQMNIFVMAGGRFRGALFHGTRFVNQMRLQHNLGILETQVLGQACLSGALLIPTMKGKENLKFSYETDGACKGFRVNADSSGFVRGFLLQKNIPIEKPLNNWDLSPFFGDGTLTISRLSEGAAQYFDSSVEIQYKNIAQDLTWYFQQSEQIQTAFNTSIFMDKLGRVTGAGGMFLQKMPNFGGNIGDKTDDEFSSMSDEELVQRVEHAFVNCPSLGQWFSEGGDLDDIIYGLFRDFKPAVAVQRKIKFDCPCSKQNFLQQIRSLNKAELDDIKKQGENLKIVCSNCSSEYEISVDEI